MTAFLRSICISSSPWYARNWTHTWPREKSVYLPDSTKFSLVRQYKKVEYGMEERRMNETEGFTILAEYFPGRGVLVVDDVEVDQTSDVEALSGFLETPLTPLKEGTSIYADRGFDGVRSIKAVYKAKLVCGIKIRETESYHGVRKKARRDFDAEGYKAFRGLVWGGVLAVSRRRT